MMCKMSIQIAALTCSRIINDIEFISKIITEDFINFEKML